MRSDGSVTRKELRSLIYQFQMLRLARVMGEDQFIETNQFWDIFMVRAFTFLRTRKLFFLSRMKRGKRKRLRILLIAGEGR